MYTILHSRASLTLQKQSCGKVLVTICLCKYHSIIVVFEKNSVGADT